MIREKRGQITGFAIVGIILLIVVLFIFYSREREGTEDIEESVILPENVQEVKSMVEGCIKDAARSGLDVLGVQGGFIDFNENTVPSSADPFSTALEVLPGGSKTAYWFYEKANGIFVRNAPSLNEIQERLEAYLDSKIPRCIDFSSFESRGYGIQKANAVSRVDIGREKVLVEVSLPLKMTINGQEFNLERFKSVVNSRIGSIYDAARKIFDLEERELFLENKTLDFMIVYDEVPYSGVDFECSPRSWAKENVRNDLKRILAKNIPFIKIEGNAVDEYFVQKGTRLEEGVDVDFKYDPGWPFYLEVKGHESDEILRGEPYTSENELAQFLLPLFCLNQYQFVYDVKYPVLVSLHSGDDVFQFAYESIIQSNQPRRPEIIPENVPEEKRICEAASNRLSIYTVNEDASGNFAPLGNVEVSLRCVNTNCPLGSTDLSGSLQANVPSCVNGEIIGRRAGYNDGKEIMNVLGDGGFSIVLDKVYEKKIKIFAGPEGRDLTGEEQAYVTFQNKEDGYAASVVYPGNGIIKLIPGRYHMTSYLLDKSAGISIPDKVIRVCNNVPRSGVFGVLGFTEKKCSEQKIEGTQLSEVIVGGNEFDFDISVYDLENYNTLKIVIPYFGVPASYAKIAAINEKIKKNRGSAPGWVNEE